MDIESFFYLLILVYANIKTFSYFLFSLVAQHGKHREHILRTCFMSFFSGGLVLVCCMVSIFSPLLLFL